MWKELYNDKPPKGITASERNFVEETVLQICTFRAFKETGTPFDAVAGMSLGDAAAGYASGVLTFQETLFVMCEIIRGVLCAGGGDLLVVQAPKDTVAGIVNDLSVTIVFQSAHSTVWAVPTESLRQSQRRLRAERIPHVRLNFNCLSHTDRVDVPGLIEAFRMLPTRSPAVRLYSTLEGGIVSGPVSGERWARSISEPSNLEAAWNAMRADGYTNIIYIGSIPADTDLFGLMPESERPTSYVTAWSMLPLEDESVVPAVRVEDKSVADIETVFRSSAFARDPYPFYSRWVAEAPVHKLPGENLFLVMGHEAAISVLKQPAVFSSSPFESLSPVLPGADAPTHTRIRRVLSPYYTRASISAQREKFAQIASYIVGNLKTRTKFDAVAELTGSVAFSISCAMMGLDGAAATALAPIPPDDVTWPDIERALLDEGMIPRIVANDEMPREDLMKLLPFLIGAGTLTVRDLLSFGFYTLFRHPHLIEELNADMSKLPAFTEELLRYEPSIHGVPRRATEDTEVGGTRIPAQSILWVWLGAANRDPSIFTNPDEFVMGRRERAIPFGAGPHSCIGHHLARLEAEIVFEAMMPHLPQLRPTGAPSIAFNELRGGHPVYPLMRIMSSWQLAFA
jgi:cytochrome P450